MRQYEQKVVVITSGGATLGVNACFRVIVETCQGKAITSAGSFDELGGMMKNCPVR